MKHARYYWLLLAESHLTRRLFGSMLRRIAGLSLLLARVFAGIESQEAVMTSVDRLGFHARLNTQDGIRGTRIAFLREVSSPAETKEVLAEMVQQARQL